MVSTCNFQIWKYYFKSAQNLNRFYLAFFQTRVLTLWGPREGTVESSNFFRQKNPDHISYLEDISTVYPPLAQVSQLI